MDAPHVVSGAVDELSCASSLGSDDPLDAEWLDASLRRLAAARSDGGNDMPPQDGGRMLTIVTWNLWFSRHAWQARLEEALWQTLRQHPDIICFQEVTTEVHNGMLKCRYLRERYDPTEERLPHGYDVATWVRRDADDGRRSSRWHCSTILLESIYGRRGLCVDLELSSGGSDGSTSRVRIVTAHLESGREMAAAREVQLKELFSHIRSVSWNAGGNNGKGNRQDHPNNHADASMLVGDFNLDPTFPENALVESNGIDVWKVLRPSDEGFTEDTYTNEMRFLHHGKHKQARYDRVVLVPKKTKARPMGIDMLGIEPFDDDRELWVSDHFGLVARIELCDAEVDVESYRVEREVEVHDVEGGYTTP